MLLNQTFEMPAPADETYALLLDIRRVVRCVLGVGDVEETSPDTFIGTFKVKVGPISVTYRGTATITARDPSARRAEIAAEGLEGVGAGRVKATAIMTVAPADSGSVVAIATDLAIAGRLAGFGRGIIDSVASKIVRDMAACLRTELTQGSPAPSH